MTSSPVRQHLDTFCRLVKAATIPGGFLLSTGEVSNYWLPIDKLRSYEVTSAVVEILQTCLPRLRQASKAETVFVPKLTTSTADTFPLDMIVSMALNQFQRTATGGAAGKFFDFHTLNFDQYREIVSIPEGAPSGTWLGIFSMSAHVKLITTMLDELHRRQRTVEYVLVLIERERVTRQRLQQRGITLVPLIVYDETTNQPTSILDLHYAPYTDYHQYFA